MLRYMLKHEVISLFSFFSCTFFKWNIDFSLYFRLDGIFVWLDHLLHCAQGVASKNCSFVISGWLNKNIVCKATLLHELPRIKLFRTDQDHSSHLCFAYFDHVFLPSPLIAFYLIKLALMLCNIYTKQILKSATLFSIFVRRNCLVLRKA